MEPSIASSRSDAVPARIGPYRVRRLLRRGGMSLVYEGEDEDIGRRVAIKVLRPRLRGGPAAARLRGEAWVANQVRHPGLLPVQGLGALPCGTPYLVMDYLEGAPLSDLLQRGLAWEEGVEIVRQVATALCALHGQGIVHRDIKPGNILVEQDRGDGRRARVLDFGLSIWPGCQGERGLVLGTPAYMAPEQWRDPGAVDGRADVYALGIVLYEVLAGERPFQAPNPEGQMRQHLNEAPRPLRERGTPSLNALVAAMLEKETWRRPSMEQVAAVLARADETLIDVRCAQERPGALRAWLLLSVVAVLGVVLGVRAGSGAGPVALAPSPAEAPALSAAPALKVEALAPAQVARARELPRRPRKAPVRKQTAPRPEPEEVPVLEEEAPDPETTREGEEDEP